MFDITAVVAPQNKGWILDRIAKEVCKRSKNATICYDNNPHEAKSYFYTHYTLVPSDVKPNTVAFFTHPSADITKYVERLRKCTTLVTANEAGVNHLKSNGMSEDQIKMIPEGADPNVFKSHKRTQNRTVLISSCYYPRKNAELLLKIISSCPSWKFKIVGKGWPTNITSLKNVEYHPLSEYHMYPELYSDCNVFLSCAELEGGGPNGLIEAMHSNIVPVVSDTGNAREYIFNGHNGFIFESHADVDLIKHYIDRAFAIEIDVSKTVADYTWINFSNEIIEYLLPHQISVT